MNFIKLPSNSKKLLDDILQADNPTEMLSSRFDDISAKEDAELRGIIRELRESGYINVNWADNKPYLVTINNSARTYEEQLAEYEKSPNSVPSSIIIDQSIHTFNLRFLFGIFIVTEIFSKNQCADCT